MDLVLPEVIPSARGSVVEVVEVVEVLVLALVAAGVDGGGYPLGGSVVVTIGVGDVAVVVVDGGDVVVGDATVVVVTVLVVVGA